MSERPLTALKTDPEEASVPLIEPVPDAPAPPAEPTPEPIAAARENEQVSLGRIAWSIATLVFACGALALLIEGYDGYASVTFAVAIAAGINLL